MRTRFYEFQAHSLFSWLMERRTGRQAAALVSWSSRRPASVYVRPAISRNVPGGAYAVTKQLPHNGREFEYRIKSASEEHERVVRESELTKA